MLISFVHNGQSYVNFDTDSESFESLPISEQDKAKIVSDAKWEVIREKRQPFIDKTDWTQMPDAQLSPEKKAEFAAYRQALRDIPQNYSNPDDVVWPTKPEI
ncbi:TPA: phage tail assembly chaperone [Vibrio cholerae]|nr:phage tail assembly chaperone [Vibrio cholerae]